MRSSSAAATTGAMARGVEEEEEEEREVARVAWWQAALCWSLFRLAGPRRRRRRGGVGEEGNGGGWRGAPGRPRELEVVKVSLPPWAERERVASPPASQQLRNSANADFTKVSLVPFPALIFI